jgi:hypothetical protein
MKSHAWTSPVLRGALALALGMPAAGVGAQTVEELRSAIEALQQQVKDLERREATTQREAAVTKGATRGSFRLPGSSTSVTLGGYVKLDAVFSNPSAGTGSSADLQLSPGAIPVGSQAGVNEHAEVKFGARESRLFVRTSTPTAYGELATHLEGDFYGADGNESVSNSHGLRLRHAYGALGPFLAGQTWTNFMFVPALPETVDFGGPAGQVFGRQAQVRWTRAWQGSDRLPAGQWSMALENPESVLTLPNGTSFRADDDRLRDLTVQWVGERPLGKLSLAGLVRQVRADADVTGGAQQRIGAALSVAAVMPTAGKDDVRFTLAAGNGLGRYAPGRTTRPTRLAAPTARRARCTPTSSGVRWPAPTWVSSTSTPTA